MAEVKITHSWFIENPIILIGKKKNPVFGAKTGKVHLRIFHPQSFVPLAAARSATTVSLWWQKGVMGWGAQHQELQQQRYHLLHDLNPNTK